MQEWRAKNPDKVKWYRRNDIATMRAWRAANPEGKRAYDRKRFAEGQERLRAAKDGPCVDCGIQYPPYVMDFDHRGNKAFAMAASFRYSDEAFYEEISKCDLVCANCHRERTWGKGAAR